MLSWASPCWRASPSSRPAHHPVQAARIPGPDHRLAAVGAFAGAPLDKTIASFTTGLGATVAGVGVLIALGAILGKLLADSGGADQIVDTILAKAAAAPCPGPWCSSPR